MAKKIINSLRNHDHWFAEWWSSVFLLAVGVYGLCKSDSFILQRSFIDGFLVILPVDIWESLFIGIGMFQLYALVKERLIIRAAASFCASSLFLWGFLNILVYGHWYFSLIAWGIFAVINLYALYRTTMGVEKHYESL